MSSRRLRERIVRRAKHAGLDVSPAVVDGLESYVHELAKWNAKINLTGLAVSGDASDDAVDRLIVEPLVATRVVPVRAARQIDVGSGGGSPAIPMKLARSTLSLTMVEVKVRKSAFLRQVSRQLRLDDTTVENTRFEALLTRPELHEAFDLVTIRAVRLNRSTLLGLQAFLKPAGLLLNFSTGSAMPEPPPPLRHVQSQPMIAGNLSLLHVYEKQSLGIRST